MQLAAAAATVVAGVAGTSVEVVGVIVGTVVGGTVAVAVVDSAVGCRQSCAVHANLSPHSILLNTLVSMRSFCYNVQLSPAADNAEGTRDHRFSLTRLAPLRSPLICPGSQAVEGGRARRIYDPLSSCNSFPSTRLKLLFGVVTV